MSRRDLLRATVALGAGAWLSPAVSAPAGWINERMTAQQDGCSVLRIAPIDWTPDGWPRVTA